MTPEEFAAARAGAVPVYEHEWQSGGIHRHRIRIMRVGFPEGDWHYAEISEPGACACVRRIDLAVLIHALMNMNNDEVRAIEDREVCADCGHRHHADDTEVKNGTGR